MAIDDQNATDDLAAVEQIRDARIQIGQEVGQVIVGQESIVEQILVALFSSGHALLVGVPGLAKTLLVRSIASALSLEYNRIQFTPDLMPADITGTEIIQENRTSGQREYRFLKGAIFANIVLADEINRTPPKTQAALLEAMQERQVTVSGTRHPLPTPFFVLATQNPIEQEGTYPLPEAQLDRFMFMVHIEYPSEDEELEIVKRTTIESLPQTNAVIDSETVKKLQSLVRRIPIADHIARRALRLARATRNDGSNSSKMAQEYIQWGAGPRASQFLVLAAKARAAIHGRVVVEWEDIEALALPILRHRIKLNFRAAAEGVTSDELIKDVIRHATENGN